MRYRLKQMGGIRATAPVAAMMALIVSGSLVTFSMIAQRTAPDVGAGSSTLRARGAEATAAPLVLAAPGAAGRDRSETGGATFTSGVDRVLELLNLIPSPPSAPEPATAAVAVSDDGAEGQRRVAVVTTAPALRGADQEDTPVDTTVDTPVIPDDRLGLARGDGFVRAAATAQSDTSTSEDEADAPSKGKGRGAEKRAAKSSRGRSRPGPQRKKERTPREDRSDTRTVPQKQSQSRPPNPGRGAGANEDEEEPEPSSRGPKPKKEKPERAHGHAASKGHAEDRGHDNGKGKKKGHDK